MHSSWLPKSEIGRKSWKSWRSSPAEKKIVIATETGCGVVPIDAAEREAREAAGRLSILLAKRAQKVIRVWCGLPESLR